MRRQSAIDRKLEPCAERLGFFLLRPNRVREAVRRARNLDSTTVQFDDQIEIRTDEGTPFSERGDSGSLVVDANMHAVGLLFGGNDVDVSYANPIQSVLDALGVEMILPGL